MRRKEIRSLTALLPTISADTNGQPSELAGTRAMCPGKTARLILTHPGESEES